MASLVFSTAILCAVGAAVGGFDGAAVGVVVGGLWF